MIQTQVLYKDSTIAYISMGTGKLPCFCLHGYGEKAQTFLFLEKMAGNSHRFIAIDLPFHGSTIWNEGLNFSIGDLYHIIELISLKEDLKISSAKNQFTLMGFSLGGRVALSLYEFMPKKFNKLILLAPDGMRVNFWYWFATQTFLGNRLFAFTMKKPKWYFLLLKLFNQLGLVNNSIYKFVQAFIHDDKVRHELYTRWTTFRKLNPNLSLIKKNIVENKTVVKFIYGKHDRIINYKRAEKFMTGMEEHGVLKILQTGHQVLNEKYADEIRTALLH